ncbi:retrotransposon protein, putative, ty1-copia subclass [Tanacetum coccineum]
MFERENLSGLNFNDWFRSPKMVLRVEKKLSVIEQPISLALPGDSTDQVLAQWNAVYDAHNEVACLMLGTMTPELHRQFKNSSPYEMLRELKSMFEKQAGVERFDLIQTFHAYKQEEGKIVGPYVIKMKSYVEQLKRLGYVLPQDLSVGLIMNGLTSNFGGFYEKCLPKKAATPQVMAIQGGRIQKVNKKSLNAKGKGKGKVKGKDKSYIPKPKNPKHSAKEHPTKDDACHHYKEMGHCKRNCPAYDTSCGTHIYNTKQGLKGERKLKQGALYLCMGNGVRAQVEAIGSNDLVLPNGLVICLDNCHFAPNITRGVVSVSCLVDNGFIQCFTDYGILVSKNYVLYYNAIPSDGIYEIDMFNLVLHLHIHHNTIGVSKRKNRTLLDMVQSMMNLTTLPLSFWDYALETAARILNMVPTTKVDKTPYVLWYGKVPKLSYLKIWGCEALVKWDMSNKLQ